MQKQDISGFSRTRVNEMYIIQNSAEGYFMPAITCSYELNALFKQSLMKVFIRTFDLISHMANVPYFE